MKHGINMKKNYTSLFTKLSSVYFNSDYINGKAGSRNNNDE